MLAYLQRLAERGARPFLLLSNRPYTHDPDADAWWQAASQVADIVPEVYFSGPAISKQGAVAGSRRLRGTMRTRMEDLIQIGVPTNRLGMMLTFSSTPKAGGREGLQPLSKWLDVVKWEAIAARQVAGELHLASIWSWGWAAFNPAGNDPDKPNGRVRVALDAGPLALRRAGARGEGLRPVARRRRTPCRPGRCACSVRPGSSRSDVSALNRLTGNRDLAYSAELQHAVLAAGCRSTDRRPSPQAEVDTILDHFGGSRSAYLAALVRAKATPALARRILADELRRRAVESHPARCLRPARPRSASGSSTYATMLARPVRAAKPCRGSATCGAGSPSSGVAPGRLLALAAGRDGADRRREGDGGSARRRRSARSRSRRLLPRFATALVAQERHAAFAVWARRRENQSLGNLTCQHDQPPQPATVDLTDWLPYLSLG